MINMTVEVDEDQLPEWMSKAMLAEMMAEVSEAMDAFTAQCLAINEKYNARLRKHMDGKVLKFPDV
ncbi:MAG: hypothetical protein ACXADY_26975 [Candidatus Hodarchaeales archaeon]|jgi:hypothetical protein